MALEVRTHKHHHRLEWVLPLAPRMAKRRPWQADKCFRRMSDSAVGTQTRKAAERAVGPPPALWIPVFWEAGLSVSPLPLTTLQ